MKYFIMALKHERKWQSDRKPTMGSEQKSYKKYLSFKCKFKANLAFLANALTPNQV